MSDDARFEDASGDEALRLRAFSVDDLAVMSALAQDAVLEVKDMSFEGRQFGMLINRVRREDPRDPPERVRSVLIVDHVEHVRSNGISRSDPDVVLSVLSIDFLPQDGAPERGELRFVFAGDGELRLRVEALELILRDIARPHAAVSGKLPEHNL